MQDKIKTRPSVGIDTKTGRNQQRGPLKRERRRILIEKISVFCFISAAFISLAALLSSTKSVRAAADSGSRPQPALAAQALKDNGTASSTPRVDALINPNAILVTLTDGAAPRRSMVTNARTVTQALTDANIHLGPYDSVTPSGVEPVLPGQNIVVRRVRFEHQGEKYPLPYRTVFKMSNNVSPGQIAKGHTGSNGLVFKIFEAKFVNEHFVGKRLISKTIIKHPVDEETLGGIRTRMAQALPSRGGAYRRMRSYDMVATGYSPYEGSGSGRCATGMRAGYGIVAVDPRVIRLGTKLYIEGYGYAIAGDTGGAIKGRRIDLGHTTHREASHVGRQHVKVWVLSTAD